VDPQDFWPVAFFGLTYKAWLFANILFMFIWIFTKSKRWRYNALVLLIGIQFILRNIQFNKVESEESDFKVMVFNTRVQQVYHEGNTSQEINDFAVSNKLDVAFMIEWLDKKGTIDKEAFPYQQSVIIHSHSNKYEYGLKAVSKHKIVNYEKIEYGHFSNNITAVFDIEIKGDIVRFVATHLQTNSLGRSDYSKVLKFDFDQESKDHAKTVVGKMRRSMERRSIQAGKIREVIEASPYPVVVLGDFNDTPMSYAYEQISTDLKDAYMTNGAGWGATYLKPFPLLRIDFILYGEELQCTNFNSTSEINSDHKLLTASFKK
jgi:endonuclease/exonuclease/phosphatase family metal-dependent hydrolase